MAPALQKHRVGFEVPQEVCGSYSREVYGRLARKIRYPSRSAARRGLRRLQNQGRPERRIYRCTFCDGVHLTCQGAA